MSRAKPNIALSPLTHEIGGNIRIRTCLSEGITIQLPFYPLTNKTGDTFIQLYRGKPCESNEERSGPSIILMAWSSYNHTYYQWGTWQGRRLYQHRIAISHLTLPNTENHQISRSHLTSISFICTMILSSVSNHISRYDTQKRGLARDKITLFSYLGKIFFFYYQRLETKFFSISRASSNLLGYFSHGGGHRPHTRTDPLWTQLKPYFNFPTKVHWVTIELNRLTSFWSDVCHLQLNQSLRWEPTNPRQHHFFALRLGQISRDCPPQGLAPNGRIKESLELVTSHSCLLLDDFTDQGTSHFKNYELSGANATARPPKGPAPNVREKNLANWEQVCWHSYNLSNESSSEKNIAWGDNCLTALLCDNFTLDWPQTWEKLVSRIGSRSWRKCLAALLCGNFTLDRPQTGERISRIGSRLWPTPWTNQGRRAMAATNEPSSLIWTRERNRTNQPTSQPTYATGWARTVLIRIFIISLAAEFWRQNTRSSFGTA